MTADEIKHWLAVVANARLCVARVLQSANNVPGVDVFDLNRAAEHLADAFTVGLEAHGQAVLKEHLAGETASVA
jgi:hypothetical protein